MFATQLTDTKRHRLGGKRTLVRRKFDRRAQSTAFVCSTPAIRSSLTGIVERVDRLAPVPKNVVTINKKKTRWILVDQIEKGTETKLRFSNI